MKTSSSSSSFFQKNNNNISNFIELIKILQITLIKLMVCLGLRFQKIQFKITNLKFGRFEKNNF
jgi:hypothetical protein